MRNLLVTGCSGYIGSNLVPALIANGYGVVGLDRRGPAPEGMTRYVEGDLLDPGILVDALDGVDGVLHLAAAKADWGLTERDYLRDNVEATRALIDAARARDVRNWVFFSSVAAMGSGHRPVDETAELRPTIAYGRSKADGERMFQELVVEDPDRRVLLIRPSVVFGPENPPDTNVFRLMDSIQRRRFVMVGAGRVVKTTSYIENLVAATLFLIEQMQSGVHPYIYVDEPRIETRELVDVIHEILDRRPPRFHLPVAVAAPLALVADGLAAVLHRDLPITSARIRKFCRATDFDAGKIRREGFRQPVANRAALERTARWYLEQAAAVD